jgi:integrase
MPDICPSCGTSVGQFHEPFCNRELCPFCVNEVSGHLRRTVNGGRWSIVPGLHFLRHSFISACASKGIDQRLIDEWVGHQTDEQRRRYRHLYPSVQAEALRSVFG